MGDSKKCWNCKTRSKGFKLGRLTHYHCHKLEHQQKIKSGEDLSPYDTLVVFSDTCNDFEKRY
jgi:hypothetical protein